MTKMIEILYCDYCNWKKVTRDASGDEKKIKCSSCGRLIKAKKIPDPQKELELQIKKEKDEEDLKKWMEDTLKYREEFNNE
jgi:transcription initiation factor TFIIIB Brf1 subunit/transcription initiation factor TFIIB